VAVGVRAGGVGGAVRERGTLAGPCVALLASRTRGGGVGLDAPLALATGVRAGVAVGVRAGGVGGAVRERGTLAGPCVALLADGAAGGGVGLDAHPALATGVRAGVAVGVRAGGVG